MVALCMRKQTSALAGPMNGINCPIFSPFVWPQHPLFSPFAFTHVNVYYHQQHQHAQILFCRALNDRLPLI